MIEGKNVDRNEEEKKETKLIVIRIHLFHVEFGESKIPARPNRSELCVLLIFPESNDYIHSTTTHFMHELNSVFSFFWSILRSLCEYDVD